MADMLCERTFTRFGSLPKELRLMIWKAALPGPRIVEIVQKPLKKTVGAWARENGSEPLDILRAAGLSNQEIQDHPSLDPGESLLGITSRCPPPAILFVCREAYEAVRMHYQRAFSCFGSFAETWFDFSSDTLYLRWETYMQERGYGFSGACLADGLRTLWRLRSRDDMQKVEHLAFMLDPDNFHDLDHPFTREENNRIYTTMVADLQCFFGGLKTFTLICDHYVDDGHFDIEFRSPIDYNKAVDRYCNFEYAPNDEWEVDSKHPFAECLHINTKAIEDIKSMRNLEGRESWRKIPQFEEKVAISKERREGLDGLCEMVWEVIDEGNKHFEATRRMMHDKDASGSSVADEDLDSDGDGTS